MIIVVTVHLKIDERTAFLEWTWFVWKTEWQNPSSNFRWRWSFLRAPCFPPMKARSFLDWHKAQNAENARHADVQLNEALDGVPLSWPHYVCFIGIERVSGTRTIHPVDPASCHVPVSTSRSFSTCHLYTRSSSQRIRVGSSPVTPKNSVICHHRANMVAEHGETPPQERIPERTCEQIGNGPVSQFVEQVIEDRWENRWDPRVRC